MKKYLKKGGFIGIPLLAVLYFLLQPGESDIFPPCMFHSATGLYCPGCGSQRAIHNMLHLNLEGTVNNNILFIPAFLAIGYHYIHPHVNSQFHLKLPNIFYMRSTPWIIFGIILLFWILRNLPWYPLTELAPL